MRKKRKTMKKKKRKTMKTFKFFILTKMLSELNFVFSFVILIQLTYLVISRHKASKIIEKLQKEEEDPHLIIICDGKKKIVYNDDEDKERE
jgi:hypothetical protein